MNRSFIYPMVCFLLKANRLSTLSLQYDKRMDDEMRGGKRKIKLVQEQVHVSLNKTELYSPILIILDFPFHLQEQRHLQSQSDFISVAAVDLCTD